MPLVILLAVAKRVKTCDVVDVKVFRQMLPMLFDGFAADTKLRFHLLIPRYPAESSRPYPKFLMLPKGRSGVVQVG